VGIFKPHNVYECGSMPSDADAVNIIDVGRRI